MFIKAKYFLMQDIYYENNQDISNKNILDNLPNF